MSFNLIFITKAEPAEIIDFPFQTPTQLTFAVINEKDPPARKTLILEHMTKCGWEKEVVDSMMEKIESMMNNPALHLSYI